MHTILVVVINFASRSLVTTVYSFMGYSSLNLRAVLTFDLTTDVLSQRARCNNCGVKGNNTFQIVYRGGSYNALIGAANTEMNGEV